MSSLKAITIGDINGIGLEILLKLFKNKNKNDFVLFTDIKIFNEYINKNKIKIKTNQINDCKKKSVYNKKLFNIFSYKSSSNEDNTVKSMIYAYKETLKGSYIGIITLPLRKDLIIKNIDHKFIGQTEFFQKLDKKKFSNMILFHKKIITSPLTTHIGLKSVSKEVLKRNFLSNKIRGINNTLKIDFNINNPRIIVSGINPHAGENGEIGFEENKISLSTLPNAPRRLRRRVRHRQVRRRHRLHGRDAPRTGDEVHRPRGHGRRVGHLRAHRLRDHRDQHPPHGLHPVPGLRAPRLRINDRPRGSRRGHGNRDHRRRRRARQRAAAQAVHRHAPHAHLRRGARAVRPHRRHHLVLRGLLRGFGVDGDGDVDGGGRE